jgi:serine/threonine protein kinase
MISVPLSEVQKQIPGLVRLQPYAVGGQKDVYLGEHSAFGRVVVKVTRGTNTERTLREVEAVQSLSSPHVPKVFAVGSLVMLGTPYVYLVEQYISGRTLRSILNECGRLGLQQCVSLLAALLETAAAMEDAHIVHRDIKPENIMYDDGGSVWLLDFGIARVLDLTSITDSQARFGPHTAGYAAPEQFRNRKQEVDARADLFSIGVVLYEALTGTNPFRANARSALEVLTRTETVVLDPIRLPQDTQGQLAGFIAVLTDRYPSRRPPSARTALAWFLAMRQTIVSDMQ